VTPFERSGRARDDRDLEHDAAAGQIYANEGSPVPLLPDRRRVLGVGRTRKRKYGKQRVTLPKL
jgi:hypothetical protein